MQPRNLMRRSAGAVRHSGWRARVAAVLVVGGLAAGGAYAAAPASAHGTTEHTVTMSGTVTLHDIDGPTSGDERCTLGVNTSDKAQLTSDPQAILNATPRCDEIRVKLRFTGVLDTNGNVRVTGSARAEEEDCFISCGWNHLYTRNYTFTLAPAGTRTITGSFNVGGLGSGSWNITFANSF